MLFVELLTRPVRNRNAGRQPKGAGLNDTGIDCATTAGAAEAGAPEPTIVVDVLAGRIVAANTAGWQLVAGRVPAERELALDRGTPALASLASLAADGGSSQGRVLDLVFWSSAGVTPIRARCEPARAREPGRLVKLVAVTQPAEAIISRPRRELLAGRDPATPETTMAEPAAAVPASDPPATPPSDAETLNVIAQRIRAGLAEREKERARAAPAAPVSATAGGDWKSADMARLAHELRTPLAAIVALAEVMRDERLGAMGNARYLGYAGDIMASAQHALEVLSASLEKGLGAGGAGEETARTDCDVNAIVAACASQLSPLAERGGVRLSAMLAAQMPKIAVNERTLRQILINLVSNALRHTPKDGEITLVTGHRLEREARIEVRDTGSGMTADEVEAAMAGRTAGARAAGPAGSMGLGLPLVKALAEANGARLSIDSRPGAGTRIALTFALAEGPAAD